MKKQFYIAAIVSFVLVGCTEPNKDLKIISADIVDSDDMPVLKICFNYKPEAKDSFISSVRVKTKDGFVFGRDDMYTAPLDQDLCSTEKPYFFLRNTRDEQYREQFVKSMKPNNIQSIIIKLGTQHVNFAYSEDWHLTSYEKSF